MTLGHTLVVIWMPPVSKKTWLCDCQQSLCRDVIMKSTELKQRLLVLVERREVDHSMLLKPSVSGVAVSQFVSGLTLDSLSTQ